MARKLVQLTSSECRAKVRTKKGYISAGVPLVYFPNYSPCWEVTDYLLAESSRISAQSLKTYADQLSVFVRFIYSRSLYFADMSDGFLHEYADYLTGESRTSNTIRSLIRRALWFTLWLKHTSRVHQGVIDFDNADAQINITTKTHRYENRRNGARHNRSYLYHEAMPPPNIPHERRAIRSDVIDALWIATEHLRTRYRRERDQVILALLEVTGARRSEIAEIRVADIPKARTAGYLTIISAKTQSYRTRDVPIDSATLDRIEQFINNDRAALLARKKTQGREARNEGKLILSAKGAPLKTQSISDEINILKRSAGITEPAHPHIFRHRHVTLVLNQIHQDLNAAGLSSMSDALIMRINSQYGWKNDEMFHYYNDQYVAESEGWNNVSYAIIERLTDESVRRELTSLLERIERKKAIEVELLDRLTIALRKLLSGSAIPT